MEQIIKNKLRDIEKKYDVKIVYACLSGSRAFGLANDNSDYDINFVYIKPLNSYLSIFESKDNIKVVEENMDINGFDIRKFLLLCYKSNPNILEMLKSEVIYESPCFIDLKDFILKECIQTKPCAYHYYSIVKNNYYDYIKKENYPQVKKYLHCIRALFSLEYMYKTNTFPPIVFSELLEIFLPNEKCNYRYAQFPAIAFTQKYSAIKSEIQGLLDQKRFGNKEFGHMTNLDLFIEEKIKYYEKIRNLQDENKQPDLDKWVINIMVNVLKEEVLK